ncbi:MAG TPA: amino acid adenylation domain-containing protein, partial [Thermoanaerobaculia bacterium]|nr:amino acid adenylation domain-containing protein [Thermoanaerobaculia bacterium]
MNDSSSSLNGVAIIGMAGRFPGASDVERFWANLVSGVESITFFNAEELRAVGVEPEVLADPAFVRARAVLEGAELFDAALFGLTPREAEVIDPQHRLLLECAWEALEQAGHDPRRFPGPVGVFAGAGINTYLLANLQHNREVMEAVGSYQAMLASGGDFLSTRISYKLGLKGPSLTVQTACSTSLVAVHLAVQSLLNGECDMALAGGVRLLVPRKGGHQYQPGSIFSQDGHCRPFDGSATGTTEGEGVGLVVLRRLVDAVAEGDHVHAVILGSAVNNDGEGKLGYTVPSVDGQSEVIALAQALGGVEAETIGLIEAHGTGTPLGDPIEVTALSRVFAPGRPGGRIALGSLKSNLGHLDAAAGVASLIKAALSVERGVIPPSLHFERPNSQLDLSTGGFYVPVVATPWVKEAGPRRAGVSSFGIGGTNAHVVLEEAPEVAPGSASRPLQLVVLSARTPAALEQATRNLAEHLRRHPELDTGGLADVAYTLQLGRAAFEPRRIVVCESTADAAQVLSTLDPKRVLTRTREAGERPVFFLFSGQGAQYHGMGAELYAGEAVFRSAVDRCAEILRPRLGLDLRQVLYPEGGDPQRAPERLEQTALAQPALFVVEYALARLWMAWGVRPAAMLGHSIGEYVAACLSGVFSLPDALDLVAERGRLMQEMPGGAMLAVPLPEAGVRPLLGRLSLAAVNGPAMCVVAGEAGEVAALAEHLSGRGLQVRRLHTSHAFHSASMEPVLARFRAAFAGLRLSPPEIPFVSNLTGTWIRPDEATSPDYWARHLRETVRFSDGLSVLFGRSSAVFLEVGPGRALTSLVRQHPKRPEAPSVLASLPTLGDGGTADAAVLRTLGQLWLAGVEIDWAGFHAGERRLRVPLPTYPFERQRYWVEPDTGAERVHRRAVGGEGEIADWFWAPLWRQAFPPAGNGLPDGAAEGSWLLFTDGTGLGDAIATRLRERGREVVVAHAGERFVETDGGDFALHPKAAADYGALLDRLALRGIVPARIVHLWSAGPSLSTAPGGAGREQERGFFSLLHLARALGDRRPAGARPALHLGIISTGVQRITGSEELVPARATLLGPAITIPQEYPGITCGLIDITLSPPGSRRERRFVDLLLAEVAAAPPAPVVAYRGLDRWLRAFEPLRLPPPMGPVPLRAGGTYLITGGLGGVGLELAGLLARQAKAKLVLIGRAPFPEREAWPALAQGEGRLARIARRLRELEAAGAEVWTAAADVTDAAALRRVVGAARQRFGHIDGAIHAAGVPGGGLMQWRTSEEAEAVLAPKVQGTPILAELLAEDALDFLVLCSSLNALVGGLGQADYTAANAFLDAFAQSRQDELPVVSINWDAWRGVGMADRRPEAEERSAEVGDLSPFPHPLLSERGTDGEGAGVFVGHLSPGTTWVLDEHRLGGHPVVPGTAYLEMAGAAFRGLSGTAGAIELRDVQFVTPLQVGDGEIRELQIVLRDGAGNGDGFHRFSARSRDRDGWQEHVIGAVGQASAAGSEECIRLDVSSLSSLAGWEEEVLGEDYREDLKQAGLGPRWEVLKKIYRRDGELVGVLELAPEFADDVLSFQLHPALLDAATSFAEYHVPGARGNYYLPLSYKRLRMLGPLPSRIYSHARLRPQGLDEVETISFDVAMLDETGVERVRVEEFTLKRVDVAATLRDRAHRAGAPPAPPQMEELLASMDPEQAVEAFGRILAFGDLPQVAVSVRPLPEVLERARWLTAERLAETVRLTPGGWHHARPDVETPYVAPRGELEGRLAAMWSDLLGIAQVGVFDDFFELGGHSLLGTQLMSRVREAFGVELPLGKLFEAATVADFAAIVESQQLESRRPLSSLQPARRAGSLPLSFAQERLWFLDRLKPGSLAYNIPAVVHLAGTLDVAALIRSLREIVRRHEVLRTTFGLADGQPVQRIAAELDLRFPLVDLAALPVHGQETEARWLAGRESAETFDLGRGPLLRATLLRLSPLRHRALFTLHHIVSDDWSTEVLVREMAALYRAFLAGLASPLPELRIQYADYALWQRGWLSGAVLAEQLGYWRERLAGAPGTLDLPADRPRPARQSFGGATFESALPAALRGDVEGLARRRGVTSFMVLLAAFEALLYRITGQECLLVGSTIANRNRREIENLIGFFVNTLVMRADITGATTWDELLAQTRESALGAYAHPDLPFEKLVEELTPARDPARSPLIQVLFQLQNASPSSLALPGLAITQEETVGQTAKFDLVVNLRQGEGELKSIWHYRTDLFDRATVTRLAEGLWRLLASATARGGLPVADLTLLSAAERHQLAGEWNESVVAPLPGGLHELFAAQATARPDAVAVVSGDRLSYGELARRADRLASELARRAVRRGDRVALLLGRSARIPVSILAVLKAGAAYVPLDPLYPAERLAFMLADSGAQVLVTEASLAAAVTPPTGLRVVVLEGEQERREGGSDAPSVGRPEPGDLAYVIYTSGSTGLPKGVGVTHANAVRLLTATRGHFGFGPVDVWTLFHSYSFDFSVWELWGALLHGGRLVVVPYEVSRTPAAFRDLLAQEGVTVLNQTPSAFRQLIWAEEAARARGDAELSLRWVIFGGEPLEPGSLAPWFARHGDERPGLVNMYGITETTVHVSYRRLSRRDLGAGSVVGRALPDLAVHVVDRHGSPVPVGVPGEIRIGGAGVAVGYLQRPELTAEQFVPDPFAGEPGRRLYRSGDLARWLPSGELEVLGRIDHQVKVRGFRIELGEIEAVLARHPAVREAVVLASAEVGEDRRLVAYVVAEPGAAPSLRELRSWAGGSLPEYMLPSGLVFLTALPLTPNRKVDRKALLRLSAPSPGERPAPVAPRTALERHLAARFAETLQVGAVGIEDDFFELGGNSIRGAVLINRLQEDLGEIVHVVAIFDAPTVADLARYLAAQHSQAVARGWGRASLGEEREQETVAPRRRVDREQAAALRALVRPLAPLPRPVPRSRRAIFVLSPPRSGSTLLRVMLGGHSGLFAPPELELLSFTTLAERREAFAGRDSFWLEGLVRAVMEARGWSAERAEAALAAAEREATTLELYAQLQGWLGERTLVDKTPSYALDPAVLARAEEGFDEPFYIHLVRHPLGMIRSFEEAKLDQIFFRRDHPFERCELAELIWLVSHENIVEHLSGVPAKRQHRIRFEDLVRDPEGVLQGLCHALGLEYVPAMARPYEGLRERMTDGIHTESRMLGDVKFHEHRQIEPRVAESWRQSLAEDLLGDLTWELAAALGYRREARARLPARAWRPGEARPLSFAQERLWFLEQLRPGSPLYNLPLALDLRGPLSWRALARSLAALAVRHEALRTTFRLVHGRPVQAVATPAAAALPVVDLRPLPTAVRDAAIVGLATEERSRPFDLARGPLVRAVLLRSEADRHTVLFTAHHTVADGWSMGILAREVGELYAFHLADRPAALPELPVQYADYAVWQRDWLAGEVLAAEVDWWRERLSGMPAVLSLPLDRPRPAVYRFRGERRSVALRPHLVEGLESLARRSGATRFMALLAVFQALLCRYTGQRDVPVGTPIAGRNRTEVEPLIGLFVNTLVLRGDLSGEPGLAALLGQVRETALGAYAHQDLPFEKLVEELAPERSLQHTPLFQAMFVLDEWEFTPPDFPGLRVDGLQLENRIARFDLTLMVRTRATGWTVTLGYNSDLFQSSTALRMLEHFEALLESALTAADSPLSELSLLRAAERHQLLVGWNDTARPEAGAGGLLHTLVAEQAALRADAVALVLGTESVTYGELGRRVEQLARRLAARGVGPEERVGVCFERSFDLVVALLAVMTAGGVYVPLDPSHPPSRLSYLLRDAGVRLLLSRRGRRDGAEGAGVELLCLEEGWMAEPGRSLAPCGPIGPDGLAYVIYTSGSTGAPNGVMVRHGSAVGLIRQAGELYRISPPSRVLQTASIGFDASVLEIFLALGHGASLLLVGDEERSTPGALGDLLLRQGVTTAVLTPAQLAVLPELPLALVRSISVGGEACPAELAGRWAPGRRLLNCYGPTEATVFATVAVCLGEGEPDIGFPVANVLAHVLDATLGPVPIGVWGELALGGAGLARGYLDRPEKTAAKFVPDPFSDRPGARLYRTGDLACRQPAGALEFLGRADDQVKVRGFRIELGEVEAALLRHSGVDAAAVVAPVGASGERRLVAYVVARPGETVAAAELRGFLAAGLPSYMVPEHLVFLDEMPLSSSGKVDRRALPDPAAVRPAAAGTYVEPRNGAERFVAGLWREVLGVERVGAEDNFFELGGNSIKGAVLTNLLQEKLGEHVYVVALFDAPTVALLARHLQT